MAYRTKTYVAGDWTGDKNAINKLYEWNNSDHWSLSFTDAHLLTQSRDNSLNCSIKKSLKERMDASKTFVLVVGNQTNKVTAGGCQFCQSYNSWSSYCARGHCIDYRSYIKYECDKAVEAGIKLVILYDSTKIDKNKCPESVRNLGVHINMMYVGMDGKTYWNYTKIKDAINS